MEYFLPLFDVYHVGLEKENIIGMQRDNQQITTEPGLQCELSGAPLENIHQVCSESSKFLKNFIYAPGIASIVVAADRCINEVVQGVLFGPFLPNFRTHRPAAFENRLAHLCTGGGRECIPRFQRAIIK